MSKHINLSEEEIEKIKIAFELVDSKGEGIFYPKEFKNNMEKMGLHEKEPFIYSIINKLDTEDAEKNGVSFDELINSIDNQLGNKNNKEGIKKIFELFVDKKDSNVISLLALKKAGNKYGHRLTNEQLKLLIEKASKNGDEITFDDFFNVMVGKN